MTAFFPDACGFKYGCSIVPDLASMDVTVAYILSKYGLDRSARAFVFCSLTVDTSFIALVICCVLAILLRRRFMSLIEAISITLS